VSFGGSQVVIGINERLEDQSVYFDRLEAFAIRLAREKGIEVAPLWAMLMKLSQAGVPEEDIPKRLAKNADKLT
jgi:hypothetical protein